MTLTDPIADMLTRIRNVKMVKKREVNIPFSRIKAEIAKILKEEGYIKNFKVVDDNKQGILNVSLKYNEEDECVITGLKKLASQDAVFIAKKIQSLRF